MKSVGLKPMSNNSLETKQLQHSQNENFQYVIYVFDCLCSSGESFVLGRLANGVVESNSDDVSED